MKGLLKLIAGLAALVVVLVVAGGAILGAFFDPNEYKPEIEQAALEKGGIELKINGDIGWSVFPWLGLAVNGVDVKYPNKAPLASLSQAQISVRLPALISGNVEMQSIVVSGLKLNLVKEKDGKTNWAADVTGKTSTTTQADNAAEASGGAALSLNIESIQVTQGEISYEDKTSATNALLSDFNMTSGQVVTNAFFPAELSFNATQSIKGEEQVKAAVKLSAEFFLNLEKQLYKLKGLNSDLTISGKPIGGNSLSLSTKADVEADLGNQQATLNNLSLSIANLNATGQVNVKDFAKPVISGNLSVASFDLNQLLKAVGQPAIETTDKSVLKAISFNTELGGPANTVTAKKLSMQLDDTKFNGSAAFNLSNGAITLNLQGDKLNADRYMPPATETKEQASTGKTQQGYSKEPVIPVDALKGLELDSTLGLKSLHVSNMDVSNIVLQVSAHGGLIKASKINADLYSGTVRNSITLDVRKKTPVMRVQKTVTGIQIGDLLKAAADVDQLSGNLNSKSDITTRGVSVHDFVNSATGTASVNMKDGELRGIDMAQTVCQGMNNISSLGIDTQQVDRSTPFTSMGASSRIKNGVVTNNDLKAALDAMALSGKGTVNLPKQLLDYRLGFMVEKNLFNETCSFPNKLEGVEIPIDCKGSFNTDPAKLCKPDFSFLTDALKNQVKEKAKAKVEEKVKDKLDGALGDKLKGLFGR